MKRFLCFTIFLALVLLVLPNKLSAQSADTLDIAPLPVGNVNNVINSDTLAGGLRAHPNRVYRLRHGVVYQVTQQMKINGSITIIANDTAAGLRPPVLAPAILADNSSIDHYFDLIGKGSNVKISNLYLLSIRADGVQLGWSNGININADSVALTLRGDVFDAFTATGLSLNAYWSKLDVQDCEFRNLQHATSYFGGQPFLSGGNIHMDTCKFINNTFFCDNSYIWSIRGYCPYSVFEHNTVVYTIVNPFLSRQAYNQHVDNNLFYAAHSYGGIPDHVINSWFLNYPDTAASSIIMLRGHDTTSYWYKLWGSAAITGPEVFQDASHGVSASMIDPANRITDIQNNTYYWPKKLLDFYTAYNDTVQTKDSVDVPNGTTNEIKAYLLRKLYLPKWMTDYTVWTIDSLLSKVSPQTTIANNIGTQDPGFNSSVSGQIDKVIAYVRKIATNTLDSTWFYNPNNSMYPPAWPLPENLAYSNSSLQHAGTDGYAVGDLNWFPTQKAQWENHLTDVKQISNFIPAKFELSQNYPNPFNPTTQINYSVPVSGFVSLKVFNILGQEVASLYDGYQKAGSYNVNFDASKLASGIYLYRLESNSFVQTKKMILLK